MLNFNIDDNISLDNCVISITEYVGKDGLITEKSVEGYVESNKFQLRLNADNFDKFFKLSENLSIHNLLLSLNQEFNSYKDIWLKNLC